MSKSLNTKVRHYKIITSPNQYIPQTKPISRIQNYRTKQTEYQQAVTQLKNQKSKYQMLNLWNQNQKLNKKVRQLEIKMKNMVNKKEEISLKQQNDFSRNRVFSMDSEKNLIQNKKLYLNRLQQILYKYGFSRLDFDFNERQTEQQLILLIIKLLTKKLDDIKKMEQKLKIIIQQKCDLINQKQLTINKLIQQNDEQSGNYKAKINELLTGWRTLCEKVIKKQNQIGNLQHRLTKLNDEYSKINDQKQQLQIYSNRQKNHFNQIISRLKKQINIKQSLNNKVTVQNHLLDRNYDANRMQIEHLEHKLKICNLQLQKMSEQCMRWKTRCQWLQSKYSDIDLEIQQNIKKNNVKMDKRLNGSSKILKEKTLDKK